MKRYIIERLISVFFTFLIGTLILFLVTRLSPIDPIDTIVGKLAMMSTTISQEQFESMKKTLMSIYGLDKPLLVQYFSFMKSLVMGDLGPSFSFFPTPVSELIFRAMPWTVGLLTTSIIIAWLAGNLIGAIAGFFEQKKFSKFLEGFFLVLSLVPYPVLALTLMILFVFTFPIFPYFGGAPSSMISHISFKYILGIIKHAFLPSLSLILVYMGASVVTMRALTISVKTEDFTEYAFLRGLPKRHILWHYVFRNSMLPQITGLTLSIGQVFGGALITESIFSYPGLGQLSYYAIVNGDYNLLMGVAFFSLVGICIAVLLLDFIYPLVDPRVRVGE
ncbi:MAG TPA: ABC transporter permease [Thermotogales bacterium]|nr:ABC transporter permease [Thermotogales bacterium]